MKNGSESSESKALLYVKDVLVFLKRYVAMSSLQDIFQLEDWSGKDGAFFWYVAGPEDTKEDATEEGGAEKQ